jgi:murein DD-endopeptidase MepM/ murein hydrolase activator NlpD
MIICPLSGDVVVTQPFGINAQYYAKYGLKAHNGVDLRCKVGTPVLAPFDGYISYDDEGSIGYGKYLTLVSDPMGPNQERRRVDLGHLSRTMKGLDGTFVYAGDVIGMSGNTGDSTGPHLHITYKKLDKESKTLNYSNGYRGALDVSQYILVIDTSKTLKPV